MPTAEQLLYGKEEGQVVKVKFPSKTLFQPFEDITSGNIYKARLIPTLTLAIKTADNKNEYFLAKPLGEVFTPDP